MLFLLLLLILLLLFPRIVTSRRLQNILFTIFISHRYDSNITKNRACIFTAIGSLDINVAFSRSHYYYSLYMLRCMFCRFCKFSELLENIIIVFIRRPKNGFIYILWKIYVQCTWMHMWLWVIVFFNNKGLTYKQNFFCRLLM